MCIFSAQIGERMPLKIVLQLGAASKQDVVSTASQINFLNRHSTITFVVLHARMVRFPFTVHLCH